jgi:phosphohistidine phosphatase
VLLYLVHHGDALSPATDPRRPLSPHGLAHVERLAAEAAARGTKPSVVWHSGKLRAKQTAEAFWRACNPFAEFSATRDLQPDDNAQWMRDRLRAEPRDVLIAGHFTHLPRLLDLLVGRDDFPAHGVIALESRNDGETWEEKWRLP